MAKKVDEIIGYSGGKEDQMSNLALFFLVIGIISLIVCLVVSVIVGEDGLSPIWIAFGIVGLMQGIALFILLSSGAEAIRLLKKLSGLKFGGEISEPYKIIQLKCSECGNMVVTEYDTECRKCGKKFESIKKEEA